MLGCWDFVGSFSLSTDTIRSANPRHFQSLQFETITCERGHSGLGSPPSDMLVRSIGLDPKFPT